jgi:hypothetical protein
MAEALEAVAESGVGAFVLEQFFEEVVDCGDEGFVVVLAVAVGEVVAVVERGFVAVEGDLLDALPQVAQARLAADLEELQHFALLQRRDY